MLGGWPAARGVRRGGGGGGGRRDVGLRLHPTSSPTRSRAYVHSILVSRLLPTFASQLEPQCGVVCRQRRLRLALQLVNRKEGRLLVPATSEVVCISARLINQRAIAPVAATRCSKQCACAPAAQAQAQPKAQAHRRQVASSPRAQRRCASTSGRAYPRHALAALVQATAAGAGSPVRVHELRWVLAGGGRRGLDHRAPAGALPDIFRVGAVPVGIVPHAKVLTSQHGCSGCSRTVERGTAQSSGAAAATAAATAVAAAGGDPPHALALLASFSACRILDVANRSCADPPLHVAAHTVRALAGCGRAYTSWPSGPVGAAAGCVGARN